MTTSVPVAGQLGTLGQVHGTWEETVALTEIIIRRPTS